MPWLTAWRTILTTADSSLSRPAGQSYNSAMQWIPFASKCVLRNRAASWTPRHACWIGQTQHGSACPFGSVSGAAPWGDPNAASGRLADRSGPPYTHGTARSSTRRQGNFGGCGLAFLVRFRAATVREGLATKRRTTSKRVGDTFGGMGRPVRAAGASLRTPSSEMTPGSRPVL